jgi:hypothetical protein
VCSTGPGSDNGSVGQLICTLDRVWVLLSPRTLLAGGDTLRYRHHMILVLGSFGQYGNIQAGAQSAPLDVLSRCTDRDHDTSVVVAIATDMVPRGSGIGYLLVHSLVRKLAVFFAKRRLDVAKCVLRRRERIR